MKHESVINFMSQEGPQKYFRQLVYYIISLIVTFNNLCEDTLACLLTIICSMMKEAEELAQTISDELFIIHDLLKCGIECVESSITSTFIRSLLQNVCFPAILNSLTELCPTPTNVSFHMLVECSTKSILALPCLFFH